MGYNSVFKGLKERGILGRKNITLLNNKPNMFTHRLKFCSQRDKDGNILYVPAVTFQVD
jgi:hypothetical protein